MGAKTMRLRRRFSESGSFSLSRFKLVFGGVGARRPFEQGADDAAYRPDVVAARRAFAQVVNDLEGRGLLRARVQDCRWKVRHYRDVRDEAAFGEEVAGQSDGARVAPGGALAPAPLRTRVVRAEELRALLVEKLDAGHERVTGFEHVVSHFDVDGPTDVGGG